MCTILLVDNNHTNINFIKSSLYESLKNYIIIESNNHNDLINNLEKQKFDVVIVNITNNFINMIFHNVFPTVIFLKPLR